MLTSQGAWACPHRSTPSPAAERTLPSAGGDERPRETGKTDLPRDNGALPMVESFPLLHWASPLGTQEQTGDIQWVQGT